MRIIAGQLRGKVLQSPEGEQTRPTADRARETLFDILSSYLMKAGQCWGDITFADFFAGSGAVGIEAFSRGAPSVVCLENDRRALVCLKNNAAGLNGIHVCIADALNPPEHQSVSVLFMDAPYGKGLWQQALTASHRAGWIDEKTLIVIETDKKLREELPAGFDLIRERSAGRNLFLFAKIKTEA